jgi:hypothetical protein
MRRREREIPLGERRVQRTMPQAELEVIRQ